MANPELHAIFTISTCLFASSGATSNLPLRLLIAEIRTKVKAHEWQILEAFIGYLDRHLGEQIESIAIHYR